MYNNNFDENIVIHKKKRKISLNNNVKYITDNNIIHLQLNVNNLKDLIELADMYKPGCVYNIDLKKIYKIKPSLMKLDEMVGLHKIKSQIVTNILYFIQDLHVNTLDMMHIVIKGPPGVGKTMLGNILGKIYYDLNIIKQSPYFDYNDQYNFFNVKRSDLIGKYLGWTAQKTQGVIDNCMGGVMFIDEAYSLGNDQRNDSFSKECMDTINQNLTERKGEFLCIIAGYENDLDKCFFSYNEGLRRRFPFVYTIEEYNDMELKQIFKRLVAVDDDFLCDNRFKWNFIDSKNIDVFFKENREYFVNMAGDMETLLFYTKLSHSKRVFSLSESYKRNIIDKDLENGMILFKENRNLNNDKDNVITHMYM